MEFIAESWLSLYHKHMKTLLPLLSVLLFTACSGQASNLKCYAIVDDPDGTQIIINEEAAQVTITDPVGGEDLVVLGRFEEGVFVYPDGSRLNYNDEKAWFAANESLVGGIEAVSTVCEK